MRSVALMILFSLAGVAGLFAQEQSFKKIDSEYFKNLYQLNESVYRSEQPSKKGFRELEAAGVKTVFNFRRMKDDARKVKGTELKTVRIPLKGSELTEAKIVEVLKQINEAEKPVLIHCFHGSDRTGVISAAYRVVFEGWSKERAVEEMRYPPFGYHEKWYPFLIDRIMELDTEKIRKELGLD